MTELRDAIERFLEHVVLTRRLAEHTLRAYQLDLADFEESVGGVPPAQVTARDVRNWTALMEAAPASRARRLHVLRSFFRFLEKREIVTVNVAEDVLPPKIPGRLPPSLPLSTIERLIEAPGDGGLVFVRTTVLVETLFGTGLRIAEAAALDVDAVDLTARRLRVDDGKGGADRVVPFTVRVRDAIRRWLEVRPAAEGEVALFVETKSGRRSGEHGLAVSIRRRARELGIRQVIAPHMLRHAYAQALADAGVDSRAIQQLLGHRKLSTTQNYARVSTARLSIAYDDAFGGGDEPR